MKQLFKSVLVLLAFGCMFAAPTFAQQKQVSGEEQEEAQMVKSPDTYAENETKSVKNELGLTDDQAKALKELHKKYASQIKAIKEDANISKEDKKLKIKALRDQKKGEIRLLLTPEQYAKWEQMKKDHHGGKGGEGKGQGKGKGGGKGKGKSGK